MNFFKKILAKIPRPMTFSDVDDLCCNAIDAMGKRDKWTKEQIDKAKLDILVDNYNFLQDLKPFGIGKKYLNKEEIMKKYDENQKIK